MRMKEERAWQLALHSPGQDDELDNALGYNLDVWHQHFVSAYVRGVSGPAAVREADAICGVPTRTAKGAQNRASRLLGGKATHSNAVLLAVENRRMRAAKIAAFTEVEFFSGVRLLKEIGMGAAKVRRTLVRSNEDGSTRLEDVEVYEPSTQAIAKALDMIGRNLGMLEDRVRVSGTISHEEALDRLESGEEGQIDFEQPARGAAVGGAEMGDSR